jgi:phosphoglycerate dehydrogenase-like enzyme
MSAPLPKAVLETSKAAGERSAVHVLVPDDVFASDAAALGGPQLAVEVYDGTVEPASVEDVEFYVVPYSFNRDALELASRMPGLKVMQLLTAGYEHAMPFVPDGVLLCNAHGVHDTSTSELALTLILATLRGIPDAVRGQDRGVWRPANRPALADKTVLILGYGSIGQAIERRLLPFETTVVRVASRARPADVVHGVDELAELLPTVDVVVVVVPLNAATHQLVNAEFLSRMKDGALLVNVARGGVVDTDALVAELQQERLFAALDVTDPEPPPPGHALWSAPNLLMTPHNGGNSSAFLPRAHAMVREQLGRFLRGEPVQNVVSTGPS